MSDAFEPPKPEPAASDASSTLPRKRFLPAFGRAALLLGGGSLLLSCGFGILVRSTLQGPNPSPFATSIFALVATVIVLTCAGSGVVLGVLSLLGFGKVDGTSHPIRGAIGAIAGGLMCVMLVASFIGAATIAAQAEAERQARLQSAPWPFVDATTGLTFERPGPEWILQTAETAPLSNPIAIAMAFDSSDPPGHERMTMILSEDLSGVDVSKIELQELGQALADDSSLTNKTVESVELTEIGSVPAVKFVISGDVEGGRFRQFAVAVLRNGRCLQILFAGEASDPDVTATEFDLTLSKIRFD